MVLLLLKAVSLIVQMNLLQISCLVARRCAATILQIFKAKLIIYKLTCPSVLSFVSLYFIYYQADDFHFDLMYLCTEEM